MIALLFIAAADYTYADLEALAKRQVWTEWSAHLTDVAPRERTDVWVQHVNKNATAALDALRAQRGGDEAFDVADQLLSVAPELERNRDFMERRATFGVTRFQDLQAQGSCDARCADWALRFSARDPNNAALAWKLAVTLRRHGDIWAALHLFRVALAKPDAGRRCDNSDVVEALKQTASRGRADEESRARAIDDTRSLLSLCGKPTRAIFLEGFASAGADSQSYRCAILEGQKDLAAPVAETCAFIKKKQ